MVWLNWEHAITWTKVYQDPWFDLSSLGHNELRRYDAGNRRDFSAEMLAGRTAEMSLRWLLYT